MNAFAQPDRVGPTGQPISQPIAKQIARRCTRPITLAACALGLATLATGALAQAGAPAAPQGAAQAPQAGLLAPEVARAPANSLGMAFVRLPAGSFLMGSAEDDPGAWPAEKPQRRVRITRAFDLGTHEVTQAQWQALMGESAFAAPRSNPYYELPGMAARITHPQHPATVSWHDAQRFIARLNAREPGARYRLPTEAEWEYAARAGSTSAYFFGDDAALLPRYAWHGGDFASGGTHPVGTKQPSPWGLYDIYGNVWEWVQDGYAPHPASAQPASDDPQGPAQASQRTVKGGSWHASASSWRSAFRKGYAPDYRGISIGFRLLREVD